MAGKAKFRSELLPASVLIDQYLPTQRDTLAAFEAESASLQAQIEALIEEQGGDDGLINEGLSDSGKINKKQLASRIKEIASIADFADELMVLQQCWQLIEKFDLTKKQIKTLQDEVNEALIAKYKNLDEAEVKKLALIKWESALTKFIESELSGIAQGLAGRLTILGNRYDETLSSLVDQTAEAERKVYMDFELLGFQL